jgi:RNA-splicing ligase RtcB
MEKNYEFHPGAALDLSGRSWVPVYSWTRGVQFEDAARKQVANVASLPFAFHHVAVMPDVHWGIGATVGSVIATRGAIVPAAVGVDLGCGMIAAKTSLRPEDLPDNLGPVRAAIEKAVPHGRTDNGGPNDRGAWGMEWREFGEFNRAVADMLIGNPRLARVEERHPQALPKDRRALGRQLCTLGTGNHFIELCVGDDGAVWIMLHSGSRGVGNRIGTYFIEKAKEQARHYGYAAYLPDLDLAWLTEDTPLFGDYIEGLNWAQDYAALNRRLMLAAVFAAVRASLGVRVNQEGEVINCHHNYAVKEHHCVTCMSILDNDSQISGRLSVDGEFSRFRDSLAGCRFSVHSCGGLLPWGADGAPTPPPLRAGALERMAMSPVAQIVAPVLGHNHSEGFVPCVCACPHETAFPSSSFLSTFGREIARHFAARMGVGISDRALLLALFPGDPLAYNYSSIHTKGHHTENVWITRKGAVRARAGDLGIIPGSMGARSYIVRGLGNPDSFTSCSHGAGRAMSRGEAKRRFSLEDHAAAVAGVECRIDKDVIDETPMAYKDVDAVLAAEKDLVEVAVTLKGVVCVKG